MPSVIVRFLRRRDAPMISTTSFHGGSCSHRLKKLEKWNRRGLLGVSFCKFGFTAGLMEQEEMTCFHFSDLLTVSGSEWQQQVMCGCDKRVWNFRSLVFSLKITTFFSNFLSIHRSSTQESRISFSASPSPYLSLNLAFLFLSFLRASLSLGSLLTMANAASGMAVSDECKLKFLELKTKRNFRFIVFKIEEKIQQVVVEKVGMPDESYDDFASSLPANECRYAVFDFDFITDENCQKSKIFFIAWSPDPSRVRSKMLYASSKDRFKRELDGIQVELQATEPSEISIEIIKGRAL